MRALTICQPYGHLVALREKPVENRGWFPPANAVGTWIAIHSGKGERFLEPEDLGRYPGMPFGAVEAVGFLDAAYPADRIAAARVKPRHQHLAGNPHVEGPCCWVFSDVIRLPEPVACNGAQGLWTLESQTDRIVRQQLAKARGTAPRRFVPLHSEPGERTSSSTDTRWWSDTWRVLRDDGPLFIAVQSWIDRDPNNYVHIASPMRLLFTDQAEYYAVCQACHDAWSGMQWSGSTRRDNWRHVSDRYLEMHQRLKGWCQFCDPVFGNGGWRHG